jgi:hypothetical protein
VAVVSPRLAAVELRQEQNPPRRKSCQSCVEIDKLAGKIGSIERARLVDRFQNVGHGHLGTSRGQTIKRGKWE